MRSPPVGGQGSTSVPAAVRVPLSLLESRIAFLERQKFSETTDIDLETLD